VSRGPDPRAAHDRHWPRDAPVRWSRVFGASLFWAALIVALVGHLLVGLVYVADLGLGMGPAGRSGEAGAWLLALAYAVLTILVVRGWFSWSPWTLVVPLAALGLLWLDGRFPFG
jgi:hypothetical protein